MKFGIDLDHRNIRPIVKKSAQTDPRFNSYGIFLFLSFWAIPDVSTFIGINTITQGKITVGGLSMVNLWFKDKFIQGKITQGKDNVTKG